MMIPKEYIKRTISIQGICALILFFFRILPECAICDMLTDVPNITYAQRDIPLNEVLSPDKYSFSPLFDPNSSFFSLAGFFSLTYATSGDLVLEGFQTMEAFICAINRINSNETLLPNTKILYHIVDVQDTDEAVLAASIKTVAENITMVVGV